MIQPAMMFIGNLNYVLVAVVGGLRVASGALSLGDVQAFIQYSRQFSQPLTQVAGMANLVQSGVASAERVFELLDAAEQEPGPGAARRGPSRCAGRVAFENVSFRYTPDKPLIEDLSLTVEPGQTVAIVGPTGAGKTTLVNLLMRFYEVTGGRITLDGVDIADDDPRGPARRRSAWCCRTPGCSAARSRRTSRTARTTPTRERDRRGGRGRPRRPVRPHPARRLRHRASTRRASNVSAGEKQLITIARAFLAEPAILILDEATSSVDTRTEVLIQRAMSSLRDGPDQLRHRAPPVHDPRRRRDPGDGGRARSSSRAPRRAAAAAAARTPGCTRPSSRSRWPSRSSARTGSVGRVRWDRVRSDRSGVGQGPVRRPGPAVPPGPPSRRGRSPARSTARRTSGPPPPQHPRVVEREVRVPVAVHDQQRRRRDQRRPPPPAAAVPGSSRGRGCGCAARSGRPAGRPAG